MKAISNIGFHGCCLALNYALTAGIVFTLPVNEAGMLFWYLNIQALASLCASWGGETWVVRTAARSDAREKDYGVRMGSAAGALSTALLCVASLAFIYMAFVEAASWQTTILVVLNIAFTFLVSFESFRQEAAGKTTGAVIMRSGGLYLISAPAMLGLAAAGARASLDLVLGLTAISSLFTWIVFKQIAALPRFRANFSWSTSLRMLWKQKGSVGASLLGFVFAWQLMFIARATLEFSEMAILAYSLRIASVVSIPMLGIGMLYSRRLALAPDHKAVNLIYRHSVTVSTVIGSFAFVLVTLCAEPVTHILNPVYHAQPQTSILALGQLVLMAFGAQSTVLAMRGKIEKLNYALCFSILVSAPLIFLASVNLGIIGAAVAVSFSMILRGLATQYQLRRVMAGEK